MENKLQKASDFVTKPQINNDFVSKFKCKIQTT